MDREPRGSTTAWRSLPVALVARLVVMTSFALFARSEEVCVDLWNAPDNLVVRTGVARGGARSAAVTAYAVDGPGRVCFVTVSDRASETQGTFVIWPDNLFENGALHDYAGPFELGTGYLGHELDRTADLPIRSDGRIVS